MQPSEFEAVLDSVLRRSEREFVVRFRKVNPWNTSRLGQTYRVDSVQLCLYILFSNEVPSQFVHSLESKSEN
jgi:hypothetical protein